MKRVLSLLAGFAGIALLAGCSTGGVERPPSNVPPTAVPRELPPVPAEQNQQPVVQATDPQQAIQPGSLEGVELTRESIFDSSSPLARRIIFFGYDSTEIEPEYLEIISNHARYLSRFNDVRVRLEGHTDERGSREYNIALGDGRASSVARILQLQGVDPGQFSTLSYGEEVPLDEGRGESSYRRNRRVEIVYEGV